MFTSYRRRFLHAFTLAAAILFAQSADASFHLWQITEIFSNADGTMQYIELTTSASGQNFLSGHQVTASQAGATHSFTLPTNLPGDTTNHKFLIGTQGFASLGSVTPDYVVPNGFLFQPNGSVDFAGVDVVTYNALPTNGVSALDRAGNIVVNAPTNFGGDTGTIGAPQTPPQAPPQCTLSATPVVISAGSSSTLSASCTPAATSYVWTNSGFGSGVSSGAVSPTSPTIYTVVASNAAGSSNAASTAVYVCNTAPSQIYAGQTLVGSGASEPFHSGIGNDTIDGGAGINTVIYNCNRSSFTLTKTASGWTLSSAAEGIDTLTNVERIQFPNETLALDISGNAGQAYRVYQAAFNRTPDNAGLKYWIGVMDSNGASLNDVAAGFINSAEFQALYGSNPTNPDFVTKLYSNVLHRAPDQAGYDYWVDVLNRHLISNIDTLVNFSESPENQAGVLGAILNGIDLLN